MSKIPIHQVKPGQKIKAENLVWGPIYEDEYTIPSKNNGRPFKVPRAKYYYLNEKKEKCDLYFVAPEQRVFGVSTNYNDLPENIAKGSPESVSFRTGLQVTYPMTSMETVSNPTDHEKIFKENMDIIYNTAFAYVASECKKKTCVLANTVKSSFKTAHAENQPETALRPLYSFPNKKDTKEPDTSKSARMYIPLMSHGKGDKLVVDTPFYPPGNGPPKSAMHFLDKRGNIKPVIRIAGLTLSGGKTYAGGIKTEIYEACYTPVMNTQHTQRLLPANDDAPVEEDTTPVPTPTYVEEDGEDEGFEPDTTPPNLVEDDSSEEEKEEEESEDEEAVAKKKAADEKRKILLAKKKAAAKK